MKRITKYILISIVVVLLLLSSYGYIFLFKTKSSIKIFGNEYEHIKKDESLLAYFERAEGWSNDSLLKAKKYAIEVGINAVVILHKGRLVAEWGKTNEVSCLHSARKSILSLLYGIAQEKGFLNLDMTLDDLDLSDKTKLTAIERTATIRDLLMSRSGIYLPAEGEVSSMKKLKPKRGSYKPGEFWYYNNWDFNALGFILEQRTKMPIAQILNEWLALPLEFEDFTLDDVSYEKWIRNRKADHRQYKINLSARDMAKIGQMLINNGRWKAKQIVPENYILESTSALTFTTPNNNSYYGYSWWVNTSNEIEANGLGGQRIRIYKHLDLVIITKLFSGDNLLERIAWFFCGEKFTANERRALEELVYAAANLEKFDNRFKELIMSKNMKGALAYYYQEKAINHNKFMFTENQLNTLAYQLLKDGFIEDAILLFSLNTEEFPNSANTYDSLAEAFMKNGQKDLAIKNYKKSLELDPKNTNAKEMLDKLKN